MRTTIQVFRRYLTVVLALLFCSCAGRNNEGGNTGMPPGHNIEEVNRTLIRKDRDRIENYIERMGLDMSISETGLWYMISDTGAGEALSFDDVVSYSYRCSLLDGTELYSSEGKGPANVRIGKSVMESGLDEGLRMLRGGGEALFILPSYLAHGIPGDGDRIPSRAILIYEIRVTEHNNQKFFQK